MTTQPEVLAAVVAALRDARDDLNGWPDARYGDAASALLRDIARLQRPVWQPIESAPKNATEILVICAPDKYGNVRRHVAHWASDTSGEEQPAFRGWFRWGGYGYSELTEPPTHWMPIPALPGADAP